jgi:hypothetical protein
VLDINFAAGKVEALTLLDAIIANGDVPLSVRMTAACAVLPYRRAKAGRFVERPLGIPASTCVADSKAAIAKLAAMARNKEISLDAANDLIAQESKFLEAEVGGDLEAQLEELKATVHQLAAANAAAPNTIVIGGMPALPGCDLDMPALANGPTGSLPAALERHIPPGGSASDPIDMPAELENPQLHEPQFRDPASTSLW